MIHLNAMKRLGRAGIGSMVCMVSKLYLNVHTEQSIFPIAGDSIGQENLQCLVTL